MKFEVEIEFGYDDYREFKDEGFLGDVKRKTYVVEAVSELEAKKEAYKVAEKDMPDDSGLRDSGVMSPAVYRNMEIKTIKKIEG
ncbi:hypothetical protein A2223_01745 [Candidatus Falkowbacteria bacterium RIFOXYA2_FULL_35_8]|nr:MAG: hypothetical protein A2223_01745 [Candidatus Falkowbacteria bacterium RIFOXYA2_FULL_35_8]